MRDARCGHLYAQYLACSWPVSHMRRATPLGCHHEQRPHVSASERASEAAAVQVDRLKHLATFANAYAALVRDVPVPDGAFGVEAYPVRDASGKVGPHSPVRQAAVRRDVEGCKSFAVGLGHDQGRVVGRHDHAIREGDTIGHLPSRPIGGDQSDDSGGELLPRHKVKAAAVDVGVTATIHDNFVPAAGREATQVGMGHQRPIGLPAQQKPLVGRDDKQASVGQKVDTHWN